jgi:(E)-4-hydroxy-3-methylbut-2-enyl-diphosphate synthase
MAAYKVGAPIFHEAYACDGEAVEGREKTCLRIGSELGGLLIDGIGDGLMVHNGNLNDDVTYPLPYLREFSFSVLQGARMRMVKTDFISCPSCGRTLFDLQEVTAQIAEKTGHLAGVSIAIMGCIVNGPGEMADADFGYVGGAPNKIDLYVGKEVIRRGVSFAEAPDQLVELIKEHGRWIDPPEDENEEEKIELELQTAVA